MKYYRFFAFILMLLFGLQSSATKQKDCGSVDFRSKLPAIRNQDSVGWCYAFTASDLVSFKLGTPVSPIDIAVSTEAAKESYLSAVKALFKKGDHSGRRVTPEGSIGSIAIGHAAKKGFCRDSELPSDDYRFARMSANLKSALNETARLTRDAKAKIHSGRSCNREYQRLRGLFPNLTPSELSETLETLSFRPMLDLLIDQTCDNRIKPSDELKVTLLNLHRQSPARKAKALNQILSSGRPAGIGYDGYVIYSMDRGLADKANHDSSIVGRRWNAKARSCEYLLRNSWGKNCSAPDPRYECKDGYIWIPEQPLMRSLELAYFIR